MTCARCRQAVCGHSDPIYAGVVSELTRAKALFQQRGIVAAMGFGPTSIASPGHGPIDTAPHAGAASGKIGDLSPQVTA